MAKENIGGLAINRQIRQSFVLYGTYCNTANNYVAMYINIYLFLFFFLCNKIQHKITAVAAHNVREQIAVITGIFTEFVTGAFVTGAFVTELFTIKLVINFVEELHCTELLITLDDKFLIISFNHLQPLF